MSTMTLAQPPSPNHRPVLERILLEAREYSQAGKAFLAVFDLDSTLFDLTLRVAAIVDSFAAEAENQKRFARECEALQNIQILRTDWGLNEALERLGLTGPQHRDFCQALHEHWAFCFFSDAYLHHDEPLPGAVAYVQELARQGADVLYLTGRDIPRMLNGTEASLKAQNFPLGGDKARLILKPTTDLDDAEFKVQVLKELEQKYERIWLFENEPVNLNLASRECPAVGLVFIDSTHSGREQVSETLDRIQHFEVNLSDLRKYQ